MKAALLALALAVAGCADVDDDTVETTIDGGLDHVEQASLSCGLPTTIYTQMGPAGWQYNVQQFNFVSTADTNGDTQTDRIDFAAVGAAGKKVSVSTNATYTACNAVAAGPGGMVCKNAANQNINVFCPSSLTFDESKFGAAIDWCGQHAWSEFPAAWYVWGGGVSTILSGKKAEAFGSGTTWRVQCYYNDFSNWRLQR